MPTVQVIELSVGKFLIAFRHLEVKVKHKAISTLLYLNITIIIYYEKLSVIFDFVEKISMC